MDSFQKPPTYLNWSTDQVIYWLSGLDDAVAPYLPEFSAGCVNGKWLSTLTADTLAKFGVLKVGHQMIILERVKQLHTQFSSFDNECLQFVLFRVSRSCTCIAGAINSLLAITRRQDNREPDADSAYPGILSDIQEAALYTVRSVLLLMSNVTNASFWLARPPFSLLPDMNALRQHIIEEALSTNRSLQQAIFTQINSQFTDVLKHAASLKERVDSVLQGCSDSIFLTPCGMELVQMRKTDSTDFGFDFNSNVHNVHVIVSVQDDSPAFFTGKVSKGDEVMEVNDQIVIGWLHYRVAELMRLSPRKVSLRLRKRPVHFNDFVGFPGASRRHLLLNQTSPGGSLSQIRVGNVVGGYILTRNPKRRTPLSGSLLTSTQENLSDQTPVSSPTSVSPPPTSSSIVDTSTNPLSSAETDEIKPITNINSLNSDTSANTNSNPKTDAQNNNNDSINASVSIDGDDDENETDKESIGYSVSRLISSTPNTPLMALRTKNTAAELHRSVTSMTTSLQCPQTEEYKSQFEYKVNKPCDHIFASIDSDNKKSDKISGMMKTNMGSTPCSLNKSLVPRVFSLTHRRILSGDPKLLNSLVSQKDEDLFHPDKHNISGYCQPVVNSPNESRVSEKCFKSSHRGSFDDIFILRKLGFGTKKPSRRISCKVLGQGDCHGWLWLKKTNSFTSKYVKRWCVCKNSTFYYYRNPEDESAEGLIILNGFTISPANAVKCGKYAFYITNDYVRFVFASYSEVDRSKWMNKLGLASIGLSSSIPTSRIGGFNPGYILPKPNRITTQDKSQLIIPPNSTESPNDHGAALVSDSTDRPHKFEHQLNMSKEICMPLIASTSKQVSQIPTLMYPASPDSTDQSETETASRASPGQRKHKQNRRLNLSLSDFVGYSESEDDAEADDEDTDAISDTNPNSDAETHFVTNKGSHKHNDPAIKSGKLKKLKSVLWTSTQKINLLPHRNAVPPTNINPNT